VCKVVRQIASAMENGEYDFDGTPEKRVGIVIFIVLIFYLLQLSYFLFLSWLPFLICFCDVFSSDFYSVFDSVFSIFDSFHSFTFYLAVFLSLSRFMQHLCFLL